MQLGSAELWPRMRYSYLTHPSAVCQEAARVGIILDLLRGPQPQRHDVPSLHLTHVDLGADGGARVLDEVGAPQVDLTIGNELLVIIKVC